ncbi:MAG: hypothetical protein JXR73_15340 [Candidatus Omnitrophica bacterium]|nr:hypothetical protein [Candidatus Omnitrophota bacterium]
MNESMKALKAICWKQYRESRWIMLAALTIAIGISLWPSLSLWKIFNIAKSTIQFNEGFDLITDYPIFLGFFGFLLAGFFFLPLLSIESERKTHALLAVKPISAEKCAFYKILTAFVTALLLVWISILSFFLIYHSTITSLTNVQINAAYPRLFFLYNGYALLTLFSFGSFFLFASACTNNRFRSFGAALLGLFAGIAFLILSHIFILESPPKFLFLQKILRLFFYGYNISTTAVTLTGCAIFIPLALAVFRIRLYHKLYNWQTYAAVSFFLLFLFTSVSLLNPTNRDLTLRSISPESLGPEARQFADYLAAKKIAEEQTLNAETIAQGPYIVSLMGNRGYLPQDRKNPQYLNLRIQKMDGKATPQLLFDRSLLKCFASDDESRLASFSDYEIFYRRDDWRLAVAQRSGILSGKIIPGRIKFAYPIPGYEEDGTSISQESSPETDYFFLGRFSLDDPVAFTPVKRCELHFIGKNGKEIQRIDCIQPGVFANADVDKIISSISAEYFSKEYNGIKSQSDYSLDELCLQNNAIAATLAIGRLQGSFPRCLDMNPDLDHYQQHRLFVLNYLADEAYRYWRTISCYDFSDPEVAAVYVGSADRSAELSGTQSPLNFNPHSQTDRFAVDGDRLVHILSHDNIDEMIVFDISQLDNIHVILRRTFPRWRQLGNWPVAPPFLPYAKMQIDEGKLLIQSSLGAYVYEIQDDYSLKKIARKTNTRMGPGIKDSRLTDRRLTIYLNDMFAQYEIGRSDSAAPIPDGFNYLMFGHGWTLSPPYDEEQIP